MRRAALLALMTSLAVLAGCAGGENGAERVERLRGELSQAREISFTADMTADIDGTEFRCRLACRKDAEGAEMTVLEPELAAGVTARAAEGETKLVYDGLELSVGAAENGGPTPVGAVPQIIGSLLSGHVTETYSESGGDCGYLVMRTYIDENGYALLWLAEPELVPARAELVYGGEAVIVCDISDFTYRQE